MTRHPPSEPDTALVERESRTLAWLAPIAVWFPEYEWRRNIGADAIAGLAVAALLIPESMGYASVAGVPTQVGLYAALAAVLAYAVTGGVSILVVGPASAVAALSASLVAEWGPMTINGPVGRPWQGFTGWFPARRGPGSRTRARRGLVNTKPSRDATRHTRACRPHSYRPVGSSS